MDTAAMHDLAQKLGENWPCVVWAYPAGLPTSVKLLQSIGVLDVNLKIVDAFKTAVAVATDGKEIGAMADADFLNIAHAFAEDDNGNATS
jgi:hypothetical protein